MPGAKNKDILAFYSPTCNQMPHNLSHTKAVMLARFNAHVWLLQHLTNSIQICFRVVRMRGNDNALTSNTRHSKKVQVSEILRGGHDRFKICLNCEFLSSWGLHVCTKNNNSTHQQLLRQKHTTFRK